MIFSHLSKKIELGFFTVGFTLKDINIFHIAFIFAYTGYRLIEPWTSSWEVWRTLSIRKFGHSINSIWGYGLFILCYDKVAVNMQYQFIFGQRHLGAQVCRECTSYKLSQKSYFAVFIKRFSLSGLLIWNDTFHISACHEARPYCIQQLIVGFH
jgi:hypothetical protein